MALKENPFLLPKEEYKRRLDFFGDYARDTAFYLSKMTGDPFETCFEYVKKNMKPEGEFPIIDPNVRYVERKPTGDREIVISKMSKFIHECISNNDLISPVFSIFEQPSVKESFQKNFMKNNIALRKKYKNAMFGYKMEAANLSKEICDLGLTTPEEKKDEHYREALNALTKKFTETDKLAAFSDKKQNNRKTSNNSVSGAYTVPSTPLVNRTAHSVLTSTCRTTSGYANANNEKLIAGNRHYWSKNIVINNITSIVTHSDYDLMKRVMDRWQLRYPTVDETMACIERGARKYFRLEEYYVTIRQYVEKLTDIERAAFVYTGDLYHIKKYNRAFIENFLLGMTEPKEDEQLENAVEIVKNSDPDHYTVAMLIHQERVRGVEVNKIKDNTDDRVQFIASTILNIEKYIEEYSDFIRCFFTTTNVPASLAYFPDSVRHAALTSDTDSTIFTTQDWVMDLCDGDYTSQKASRVSAAILLFASQTIVHILALMSANFGINTDELFIIAMKSEFKFQPFCPSNVSKHYMASIDVREGKVYLNPDREVKGVHMRSSTAPESINKAAKDLMNRIMDTVREGKKISILSILKEVADSERRVMESIRAGRPEYCRYTKIKELSTYRNGAMNSPYQYHIFWNEVFGPKYGTVSEPPYLAVKISTDLKSFNAILDWTNTFEDRALADRLVNYCKKHDKKRLMTFYIPEAIAANAGIPQEILEAADYRGAVMNIHKTFYIVLEILGIYMEDKKVNKLVSDFY